jgi:hypothetical protein
LRRELIVNNNLISMIASTTKVLRLLGPSCYSHGKNFIRQEAQFHTAEQLAFYSLFRTELKTDDFLTFIFAVFIVSQSFCSTPISAIVGLRLALSCYFWTAAVGFQVISLLSNHPYTVQVKSKRRNTVCYDKLES